jgi:putative hemolysin
VYGLLLAAETAGGPHWTVNALMLLSVPALVVLALVAVRRTRVEQLVKEGVKGARAVEDAVENLDRSIAATQLGITLASIGLGFLGEPALARLLKPLFASLPEPWGGIGAHSVAVPLAFFLITFMHVVFGELIPKTMALQIPDKVSLWLARPLMFFERVTRPLIYAMNGTGNGILRWAGYKSAGNEGMVHSVEELLLLVEDTEEAGLLEEEQAELVENVFLMTSKKVRDVMVPREKMATLELSTPPEQVLEVVRQGAHTRLPVYEKELNNIVGIVNTKDLFYLFSLQGVVVLQDALYPAVFLPADEPVINALRLFKKSHKHMAVVRDDKDAIVGLLTLEDVLEEIVGDIEDEHDQPRRRPLPKVMRRVVQRLNQPAKPQEKPSEKTGKEPGKKEPTNAEKIVGTWEVTKAPEGPPGATFEFTRDGKMKMTAKVEGQTFTSEGTYKVEGDTLTTAQKQGPKEVTEQSRIKTLNSTTLVTEDEKGQAVAFKKK